MPKLCSCALRHGEILDIYLSKGGFQPVTLCTARERLNPLICEVCCALFVWCCNCFSISDGRSGAFFSFLFFRGGSTWAWSWMFWRCGSRLWSAAYGLTLKSPHKPLSLDNCITYQTREALIYQHSCWQQVSTLSEYPLTIVLWQLKPLKITLHSMKLNSSSWINCL